LFFFCKLFYCFCSLAPPHFFTGFVKSCAKIFLRNWAISQERTDKILIIYIFFVLLTHFTVGFSRGVPKFEIHFYFLQQLSALINLLLLFVFVVISSCSAVQDLCSRIRDKCITIGDFKWDYQLMCNKWREFLLGMHHQAFYPILKGFLQSLCRK
jgi:hypothetical protein